MSLETIILAVLAAVVFLAFASFLRVEDDPALRLWAGAWAVLMVDQGLSIVAANVGGSAGYALDTVTYFTSTALPFVLFFAALAYARRAVPRWMILAALAVCALRTAVGGAGYQQLAFAMSLAVEVPADLAGAAVILAARERAGPPPVVILLAVAYTAVAAIEGTAAWSWMQGGRVEFLVLPVVCAAMVMASSQLLAIFVRVREREERALRLRERDLEVLREIARCSASQTRSGNLVENVLALLRERLGRSLGGVWLLDDSGATLECAHAFGIPEALLARYLRVERPEVIARLLSRPRFSVDVEAPEADLFPKSMRQGLGGGALLPLVWNDEPLGVLVLSIDDPENFGPSGRRLFMAVADELALSLRHVSGQEERIRQAKELAHERRNLRAVLDSSPAGVVLEDHEGRIAMLNPAALRHLHGSPDEAWVGRAMDELLARLVPLLSEGEPGVERLRELRAERDAVQDFELAFREPEGRTLLLFTSLVHAAHHERVGRVWIFRDVSEERTLQQQLRQAQKLDTLGRLAGGIAHDFNNQLTAILGNARLALERLSGDAVARESLYDLERAAEHCAGLTRSLLAFSRRTPISVRALPVAETIDELRQLLRPLIPATIDLTFHVEEGLACVAADPTQLQQILLNLAVNARDAISGAGSIRIEARERRVRTDEAHGHPDASAGIFVELSVSDDGEGMEPAVVDRIFDPFFTTKAVGQGTGLGLAIVYGVVRAQGGWVEVETEPGHGTCFRVLLPAAAVVEEDPVAPLREAGGSSSGTILLAEDDPGVRRVACRILEKAGYRVIAAVDGDEAFARFQAHKDEIHLVMLDVLMPRTGGVETLRRIREHDVDLPAILMSGNTDPSVAGDPSLDAEFIEKPYDAEMLLAVVRQLLEDAAR